jgi:hypothetical protein
MPPALGQPTYTFVRSMSSETACSSPAASNPMASARSGALQPLQTQRFGGLIWLDCFAPFICVDPVSWPRFAQLTSFCRMGAKQRQGRPSCHRHRPGDCPPQQSAAAYDKIFKEMSELSSADSLFAWSQHRAKRSCRRCHAKTLKHPPWLHR